MDANLPERGSFLALEEEQSKEPLKAFLDGKHAFPLLQSSFGKSLVKCCGAPIPTGSLEALTGSAGSKKFDGSTFNMILTEDIF